jgi:CubicO group peptidase (beta-lactamase class C family)
MPSDYPLPSSDPASLGFAAKPLDHLDRLIKQHIEEGRYPGAQIALARHGQLALFRTYGDAKVEPARVPATNDTLFLLFSQTKVLTSSAVWALVEEGKLSFMDKIADHLPEFARRGKADITLHQVMTHQGGFPSNNVTQATSMSACRCKRNHVAPMSMRQSRAITLRNFAPPVCRAAAALPPHAAWRHSTRCCLARGG